MPEIPNHDIPKRKERSERKTRLKQNQKPEGGIYSAADGASYMHEFAVPALAEFFGVSSPTRRALVGKYGTLTRSAVGHTSPQDRLMQHVSIERTVDIDDRERRIGIIVLRITICHYHTLDEAELIAEWPILEDLGVADDLMVDAINIHVRGGSFDEEDLDLEDAGLNAEIMQGQLDTLSELDEEDNEPMVQVMYGQSVERYYEKQLQLVTGMRPSLRIRAGYDTDVAGYSLDISDGYFTELTGDSPAEIDIMSQLRRESFAEADADTIKEFEETLVTLGILNRKE